MRKNFLRLPEARILVAQLRLVMASMSTTVLPIMIGVPLLLVMLHNDSNKYLLLGWGFAQVAASLNSVRFAKSHRHLVISSTQAHRTVCKLMMVLALEGTMWGAFCWVALDTTTLRGSFFGLAVPTGIIAAAVSNLGTIRIAYFSFLLPIGLLVAARLWATEDIAYRSLIVMVVLFTVMMYEQANRFSRTVRKSIELRFENAELLKKLRLETAHAETARQDAEQANLAKSKFLAAASHDLRQPIHAQGLFLDVLSRTALSPMQQDLVASAGAASSASSEMLNTLLDFSRIEAGVVEPQVQAFLVQPLLNKIEREFVQLADAKGLEYRSRESTLGVQSDPALIELILRNLVSNAIRYTERGGLLVTCRRRGNEAVLEVFDTGIGIEVSQQAAVFREFQQLGNPERDRAKGLGLGLAIVEGLARTLGHGLSLDSKVERGSVFRLRLALASSFVAVAPATDEVYAARQLRLRVLVVDDDDSVRHSMLHLLRDWGCECEAVDTVEGALQLAGTWPPGFVISDYRLRNHRTGVEVIKALRELLGQDLPALLITGDTAPQRLREAVGSGLPLLHKPVTPSRLYRELLAVLPARSAQ